MTISTSNNASPSAFATSMIDSRTNSDVSMLMPICMSGGKVDRSSSTRFATLLLTSSRLACACGTMARLMPLVPSVREKLRTFSGASSISATSPSLTR